MSDLVKAISRELLAAGVNVERLLLEPVPEGVSLSWRLPPLCSGYVEVGAPVESLWNFAPVTSLEEYLKWYNNTLWAIYRGQPVDYQPYRQQFAGCPVRVKVAARVLYSRPEGWPNHGKDAACMFALEAAEHLLSSHAGTAVEQTEDTFLVTVDGVPTVGLQMSAPFARDHSYDACLMSSIPSMRSQYRGLEIVDTDQSPLHKVRAWAITHTRKFLDFERFDLLLQGFYFGHYRKYSPLASALHQEKRRQHKSKVQAHSLRHVIENWRDLGATDRDRLVEVMNLLVPVIFTPKGFLDNVYPISRSTPSNLPGTEVVRILDKLNTLYEKICAEAGITT